MRTEKRYQIQYKFKATSVMSYYFCTIDPNHTVLLHNRIMIKTQDLIAGPTQTEPKLLNNEATRSHLRSQNGLIA